MSETLAISPDWNACYCYLLVLVLGLIVAYSRVTRLFEKYPGAWGTVNIWLLLLAYTAVPLILFWSLDWTNAIHDTSFFAAVLIAAGYRQLLSGRMTGIRMPNEAGRFWQPFEAWANWLGDRIRDRVRLNSTRYTDQVIRSIQADPEKLNNLRHLVLIRVADPQKAQADYDALSTSDAATLWGADGVLEKQIRYLYESLRSVPDSDLLMRRANIISWHQYLWFAKEWRSKSRAWFVVAAAAGVLLSMGPSVLSPENRARYYLWRLEKPNATTADRLRSTEAYSKLVMASPDSEFTRIGRALRYEPLPVETAERLIGIVIRNRASSSSGTQSALIQSLTTESPDTRARVQTALTEIATAQNICLPLDLSTWKPSKNDSATEIDVHMKEWQTAWSNGTSTRPCQ
jgi:hypothetical protein